MKKEISIFIGISVAVLILAIFLFRAAGRPKKDEIEQNLPIRPPAVAGSFYSADKETLSEQIDGFLANVPPSEKRPTILIVPHAGYEYSGQVAAYGFNQLVDSDIKRVIILGATHQVPFSGAAVFDKGFWQTPLGKVAIDADLATKIITDNELVFESQQYHQKEHSLEVELPFLQKVLVNFQIVPILMGEKDEKLIEDLATVIAQNLDSQTLLIISTDLSHYPSYEDAKKVDEKTINAILSGEGKNLDKAITESMAANIPGLATCACAEAAIRVGMRAAQKMAISDIRLLNYANSGDITGTKERIVGYASIGFYSERVGDELNLEEQEELLGIARQTLESYLKDRKIPDFEIAHPFLNRNLGAFVTLRKNGQLRGCIGQFEPDIPLWQVVRQKAIDAALHDARFSPVTLEELKDIKIEVSVLSPRQKIDDWRQIELGKHGVVIQKGQRSGVFLPQVATETGWDLETFMGQLCSQKAGLAWDCWQKDDVDLFTFTAQIFEEE